MSLNKKDLNCWAAIDRENIVLTGHCTCMAGAGEVCTHVTALLFLVVDGTEKKSLTTNVSIKNI